MGSTLLLSSCAKCNICETEGVEVNVCTNSVIDQAKAKSDCKKSGGTWERSKRL